MPFYGGLPPPNSEHLTNPRRGSVTGSYTLPVPPDWYRRSGTKLISTGLFPWSGRDSPIGVKKHFTTERTCKAITTATVTSSRQTITDEKSNNEESSGGGSKDLMTLGYKRNVRPPPSALLQEPEPEDIESTACWKIMNFLHLSADPEGPGCCALLLAMVSILLIIATLPFSLCMCIKVSDY